MSLSERTIVFFLLACSPACGRQVVHFVADAGPDADTNSGGSGGGAGHSGGAAGGGHAGGGGGAGHNGGGASGPCRDRRPPHRCILRRDQRGLPSDDGQPPIGRRIRRPGRFHRHQRGAHRGLGGIWASAREQPSPASHRASWSGHSMREIRPRTRASPIWSRRMTTPRDGRCVRSPWPAISVASRWPRGSTCRHRRWRSPLEDLTLDAQGDSNAVFIFQMASTLTTTVGRQVVLTNGAAAANIFWQVGSSATLGTSSVFDGTIMADQTVTLNSGATLNGRALAHIGAVNLASNSIVGPPL